MSRRHVWLPWRAPPRMPQKCLASSPSVTTGAPALMCKHKTIVIWSSCTWQLCSPHHRYNVVSNKHRCLFHGFIVSQSTCAAAATCVLHEQMDAKPVDHYVVQHCMPAATLQQLVVYTSIYCAFLHPFVHPFHCTDVPALSARCPLHVPKFLICAPSCLGCRHSCTKEPMQ